KYHRIETVRDCERRLRRQELRRDDGEVRRGIGNPIHECEISHRHHRQREVRLHELVGVALDRLRGRNSVDLRRYLRRLVYVGEKLDAVLQRRQIANGDRKGKERHELSSPCIVKVGLKRRRQGWLFTLTWPTSVEHFIYPDKRRDRFFSAASVKTRNRLVAEVNK